MKTAMQELIEVLETQKRLFIEAERHTLADGISRTILLSKQFLEKEKEQIKEAVNYGNRQDHYDATEVELSNYYYNQTYNQNELPKTYINGVEVDSNNSSVTTTGVWTSKTNNL